MYVKLLKVFFAVLFFLATCLVIRLYTYDVYHFWSLNDPHNAHYSGNARVQDAAFINHLDFDSVILGNSHMENTSAKMASDIFGGTFFNLSMSGSNNFERSIVLNRVLETHNTKRVILLLTPLTSKGGHGDYSVETWNYLYDSNPFNDAKYYFNTRDFRCMRRLSPKSSCLGVKKDLDRPYAWSEIQEHSRRFGGIQNWARYYKDPQLENLIIREIPEAVNKPLMTNFTETEESKTEISSYLDETVFDFVGDYPNTEFLLYFNPDSLLGKALDFRNHLAFSTYAQFVKQVTEKASHFPNVHFFGFDNLPFTNDIAFYKDPAHYKESVNSELLVLMSQRQFELTPDNVDDYLKELWIRIKNFDLSKFNSTLQNELQKVAQ